MKYKIPSTSSLNVFDSAAKYCSFSRAAEELHTSQSAVSRHIADLESRLSVKLFDRTKRKLCLTTAGEYYYRAISKSLENIQHATNHVANSQTPEQITIASTHEISHLFLLPRFDDLQSFLGKDVLIRMMTYNYDSQQRVPDSEIDIMLTYHSEKDSAKKGCCPVLKEAINIVCSPSFAELNKGTLSLPFSFWLDLPLLKIERKNHGWATWEDWFKTKGIKHSVEQSYRASNKPNFISYYNYVYLLEAAAAGNGLALGWRGLVDRYIEAGSLVSVSNNFIEFDSALYAELTTKGRHRKTAQRCLQFLTEIEVAY